MTTTEIPVQPTVKMTGQEEAWFAEHLNQQKRTASVTGKTLSLILQIDEEAVPKDRRADLATLKDKATVIYLQMMSDTFEDLYPGGVRAAPQEAALEPMTEASRDPVKSQPEQPVCDEKQGAVIDGLGRTYHWGKLKGGEDKAAWKLDDVEEIPLVLDGKDAE